MGIVFGFFGTIGVCIVLIGVILSKSSFEDRKPFEGVTDTVYVKDTMYIQTTKRSENKTMDLLARQIEQMQKQLKENTKEEY